MKLSTCTYIKRERLKYRLSYHLFLCSHRFLFQLSSQVLNGALSRNPAFSKRGASFSLQSCRTTAISNAVYHLLQKRFQTIHAQLCRTMKLQTCTPKQRERSRVSTFLSSVSVFTQVSFQTLESNPKRNFVQQTSSSPRALAS